MKFNVEFSENDESIIEELSRNYCISKTAVVFKAVSLLYTVYNTNPYADYVFVNEDNIRGKIPIPLTIKKGGK